MSYDPDDHTPTWDGMAGLLLMWAVVMVGLVCVGHRGAAVSREPTLLAEPWRAPGPGAKGALPEPLSGNAGELHSS